MIHLIGKKIAVSPIFDPNVSEGGIIIPDVAKSRCDQGIVKYIGPEVEGIDIGDYVLFSGYTGSTVRIEGEGLIIILHEDFVTCKILDVNTEVPGLYFKDNTGVYFQATYEMAMNIIGQSFGETNKRKFGMTDRSKSKPKVEDYKRGI